MTTPFVEKATEVTCPGSRSCQEAHVIATTNNFLQIMKPTATSHLRTIELGRNAVPLGTTAQNRKRSIRGSVWREKAVPCQTRPFRVTETAKYTRTMTVILSVWFRFPCVSLRSHTLNVLCGHCIGGMSLHDVAHGEARQLWTQQEAGGNPSAPSVRNSALTPLCLWKCESLTRSYL